MINDKRVIRDFFKVLVNYKHIQSFKRLMDFRNDLENRGVIGFSTVTNSRLEEFWENCNRNNWSFGNDSYFVQAVFEKDNIIGLCLDEIRISKDKEGQSIEEAITADIPNFSFNIKDNDLNVRFVWERDERTSLGYYFILREIKVAKGSQIPTSIKSNLFDIDWSVIKRIIKNKEY
jgi:hypothetical protein